MREEKDFILYHGERLPYTRYYKEVKNLNLRIRRDGSVVVSANGRVSAEQVRSFVKKNAEFVLRTKKKYEERAREESLFTCSAGDKVSLLGKTYRMNVLIGEKEGVRLFAEEVVLTVRRDETARKKKIWEKFLKEEGLRVFTQLTKKYYPAFARYTPFPEIQVKNVKSKWGSCTPAKGLIVYAEKLLEKETEAIEYVVVHELSHFVYRNHSKNFYAVVQSVLPDWKERKKLLYTQIRK